MCASQALSVHFARRTVSHCPQKWERSEPIDAHVRCKRLGLSRIWIEYLLQDPGKTSWHLEICGVLQGAVAGWQRWHTTNVNGKEAGGFSTLFVYCNTLILIYLYPDLFVKYSGFDAKVVPFLFTRLSSEADKYLWLINARTYLILRKTIFEPKNF